MVTQSKNYSVLNNYVDLKNQVQFFLNNHFEERKKSFNSLGVKYLEQLNDFNLLDYLVEFDSLLQLDIITITKIHRLFFKDLAEKKQKINEQKDGMTRLIIIKDLINMLIEFEKHSKHKITLKDVNFIKSNMAYHKYSDYQKLCNMMFGNVLPLEISAILLRIKEKAEDMLKKYNSNY